MFSVGRILIEKHRSRSSTIFIFLWAKGTIFGPEPLLVPSLPTADKRNEAKNEKNSDYNVKNPASQLV